MPIFRIDFERRIKCSVQIEASSEDSAVGLVLRTNGITDEANCAKPIVTTPVTSNITNCIEIAQCVHYLRNGFAACGDGMPDNWIASKWSYSWEDVTCQGCLAHKLC